MKKLFLLLASLVAICSCDKENSDKENSKIDPSLVNVEIELSCIDEEPVSIYDTKHTILCTGKIGGFVGKATIEIRPTYNTRTVSVAGESTSFSYTFTETQSNKATNKPRTYDVMIYGPNYEALFRSSVVIFL